MAGGVTIRSRRHARERKVSFSVGRGAKVTEIRHVEEYRLRTKHPAAPHRDETRNGAGSTQHYLDHTVLRDIERFESIRPVGGAGVQLVYAVGDEELELASFVSLALEGQRLGQGPFCTPPDRDVRASNRTPTAV